MAQRCSYCGKTEKQHKGPCIDPLLQNIVKKKWNKKDLKEFDKIVSLCDSKQQMDQSALSLHTTQTLHLVLQLLRHRSL